MERKKWAPSAIEVLIFAFVLIIAIICLMGFLECIHAFSNSQQLFSEAYTAASAAVVKAAGQNSNEDLIRHLEQLQTVQKNSLTNDLMSFVYGVLSTLLVGLCAGFVAKSQKNAQAAQDAADSVEKKGEEIGAISNEAKKKLDEIKKTKDEIADSVEKKGEEIGAISNEAKEKLDEIKKIKDEIDKVFKNIGDEFEDIKQKNIEQARIQKISGTFLALHVEIIHARTALMSFDQVESNARIYGILRKIESIDLGFDRKAVTQLRTELLALKSVIDAFESKIDIEFTDPQKKKSMHCSAERYEKEIMQAIKACDEMVSPV